MQRFAALLKALRERDHLSQRAMADKLGCSQGYIEKCENVRGETVGLKWVERVVERFHVDPIYFFTTDEAHSRNPLAFVGPERRTLEQRVADLEQRAGKAVDHGSGPRPIRPARR